MKNALIVAAVLCLFIFTGTQDLHAQTKRIMTLGDSIIKGANSKDGFGFRDNLQDLLNGISFSHVMVGPCLSPADGPPGYDCNHSGVGGAQTIHVLKFLKGEQRIPAKQGCRQSEKLYPLVEFAPDIVLIHVGYNNFAQADWPFDGDGGEIATAVDNMEDIVDVIRGKDRRGNDLRKYGGSEEIEIYIALVIPTTKSDRIAQGVSDFCRELGKMLREYIEDSGSAGVHIVDMHSRFPKKHLAKDPVHPGDEGYDVIARYWFEAMQATRYVDVVP